MHKRPAPLLWQQSHPTHATPIKKLTHEPSPVKEGHTFASLWGNFTGECFNICLNAFTISVTRKNVCDRLRFFDFVCLSIIARSHCIGGVCPDAIIHQLAFLDLTPHCFTEVKDQLKNAGLATNIGHYVSIDHRITTLCIPHITRNIRSS